MWPTETQRNSCSTSMNKHTHVHTHIKIQKHKVGGMAYRKSRIPERKTGSLSMFFFSSFCECKCSFPWLQLLFFPFFYLSESLDMSHRLYIVRDIKQSWAAHWDMMINKEWHLQEARQGKVRLAEEDAAEGTADLASEKIGGSNAYRQIYKCLKSFFRTCRLKKALIFV